MKKSIKSAHQDKLWRGVPGVEMIWHGEWSDPELEYEGTRRNYWDVEDAMYEWAKEDGIDTENDEEFNRYCQEHAYDVYECFSSCGKKKGKKKPVTSGNLSMKERAANREFEKQQKEHYAKPGTQRAKEHSFNKIESLAQYTRDKYADMYDIYPDAGYTFFWELKVKPTPYAADDFNDSVIQIYGAGLTNGGDTDYNDDFNFEEFHFEQDLIWDMLEAKPWNGHKLTVDKQGDEIWIMSPSIGELKTKENIDSFVSFLDKRMNAIAKACAQTRNHRKSLQSSRRPIQSMYVTQDISGNDLYTCLWSGGKDQFDSMIEDGADADDILNACEELLFREEGNPPTMTELNDLIWFEPDTIREYIGLSNPIESGCHGKSKKRDKKKAVKSDKKSVKSAYNPYNGKGSFLVSIDIVEQGEHETVSFSEKVLPLEEFISECRDYAESINGYYTVTENGENQYKIEFGTSDDSFADEPGTDPYYEESCGVVVVELIYPFDEEMADYIENGGY